MIQLPGAEAGGLAPHAARAARTAFEAGSILDRFVFQRGEQWSRTTHASVPAVFKAASSPARIALRGGRRRTRTSRHVAARIAFQASSVPDGLLFHGLDGRNRTCNLSAPNRALYQIEPHPGVVPLGTQWAICESNDRTDSLIRESRVTNPSWPVVVSPTAAAIGAHGWTRLELYGVHEVDGVQ